MKKSAFDQCGDKHEATGGWTKLTSLGRLNESEAKSPFSKSVRYTIGGLKAGTP